MFKKIRGLVVAGLLVVGMSGNIFADNYTIGSTSGCILNGSAGVHNDENHTHIIKKEDRQTQTKIDEMIDSIYEQVNGVNSVYEGYFTVVNSPEDEYIEVYRNFDGQQILVERIDYVVYTEEDQLEKGWLDLEITPETGDAIALGGLAIAGVAAGALALNNKKKNKK